MSTPKILACSIQNLTDARYFAAWEADWREATRAIATFAAPHERSTALRALIDEAASAFDDEDCWERLCRVADALEAHGTLDRDLFGDAIGEE